MNYFAFSIYQENKKQSFLGKQIIEEKRAKRERKRKATEEFLKKRAKFDKDLNG